jgi:ion channel-forming bestrophin family protein
LEILSHCSAIIKAIIDNGTFKAPIYQTQAFTLMSQMNEVLTGTERVLNTPFPIAYSIAIAQIMWTYILLLPFQLFGSLGWVTIPATTFSAYVILGIALIGREIEDPFGDGVNDLPLDSFCD